VGVTALTVVTAAERPDLASAMQRLGASPSPEFLHHDPVVNALWPSIYELAPRYQLGLLDEEANSLAAKGTACRSAGTEGLKRSRSAA
jgi:hypothetical protein